MINRTFKFIQGRIRIRIRISIIYRSILRTVSDNYKKHTTKGYISSKSSKKKIDKLEAKLEPTTERIVSIVD